MAGPARGAASGRSCCWRGPPGPRQPHRASSRSTAGPASAATTDLHERRAHLGRSGWAVAAPSGPGTPGSSPGRGLPRVHRSPSPRARHALRPVAFRSPAAPPRGGGEACTSAQARSITGPHARRPRRGRGAHAGGERSRLRLRASTPSCRPGVPEPLDGSAPGALTGSTRAFGGGVGAPHVPRQKPAPQYAAVMASPVASAATASAERGGSRRPFVQFRRRGGPEHRPGGPGADPRRPALPLFPARRPPPRRLP
jgi:hypothetical protein